MTIQGMPNEIADFIKAMRVDNCLLYTSDAADEL